MSKSIESSEIAYIGLGSNLDNPVAQVTTALEQLAPACDGELLSHSALYRSPPMGPPDQPDYINAVASVSSLLTPHQLLERMLELEQQHGRQRRVRWGPRTLDLDLLLVGERILQDDRLILPHPALHERAFVLYPLAEIAPDLQLPGLGSLRGLLSRCALNGLERLAADRPLVAGVAPSLLSRAANRKGT